MAGTPKQQEEQLLQLQNIQMELHKDLKSAGGWATERTLNAIATRLKANNDASKQKFNNFNDAVLATKENMSKFDISVSQAATNLKTQLNGTGKAHKDFGNIVSKVAGEFKGSGSIVTTAFHGLAGAAEFAALRLVGTPFGLAALALGAFAAAVYKAAEFEKQALDGTRDLMRYGQTVGDSINNLAIYAGNANQTMPEFIKNVKGASEAVTQLGGLQKFGQIFTETDALAAKFNNFGLTTDELHEKTAQYAKMLSKTGALQSLSARQVGDSFNQLMVVVDAEARITGKNRDELLAKALSETNEDVTNKAAIKFQGDQEGLTNFLTRYQELQNRYGKEQADDLAKNFLDGNINAAETATNYMTAGAGQLVSKANEFLNSREKLTTEEVKNFTSSTKAIAEGVIKSNAQGLQYGDAATRGSLVAIATVSQKAIDSVKDYQNPENQDAQGRANNAPPALKAEIQLENLRRDATATLTKDFGLMGKGIEDKLNPALDGLSGAIESLKNMLTGFIGNPAVQEFITGHPITSALAALAVPALAVGVVKATATKAVSGIGSLVTGLFKGGAAKGAGAAAEASGEIAAGVKPAGILGGATAGAEGAAGGIGSRLAGLGGKALRGARGGGIVSGLFAGAEIYMNETDNSLTADQKSKKDADAIGSAVGGTVGAGIGTLLGPLGTIAGGIAGAKLGEVAAEIPAVNKLLVGAINLFRSDKKDGDVATPKKPENDNVAGSSQIDIADTTNKFLADNAKITQNQIEAFKPPMQNFDDLSESLDNNTAVQQKPDDLLNRLDKLESIGQIKALLAELRDTLKDVRDLSKKTNDHLDEVADHTESIAKNSA